MRFKEHPHMHTHMRHDRSMSHGPRGRGGRGHGPGPRGRGRGGSGRPRVSRGDVRLGILALLEERPMHGYQLMQELEERSDGAWQPSPGSIYPTLQQLADEGLIQSEAEGGKNIFSLTADGQTAAAANEEPPPWERFSAEGANGFVKLHKSVFQLTAAAKQVSFAGSQSQVEQAKAIIDDARKGLYKLLAEDQDED